MGIISVNKYYGFVSVGTTGVCLVGEGLVFLLARLWCCDVIAKVCVEKWWGTRVKMMIVVGKMGSSCWIDICMIWLGLGKWFGYC